MIRAVLSDIGGVVLHMDWREVGQHWERELGLAPGEFLRAVFGGNEDTVLVGRVSEDEWWDEVCRRLGSDATLRARFQGFHAERERYDAVMVRFLASLRPSYRVAFVSNAWTSAREHVRARWNLHEVCDEMIFSCDVGVAKPYEGIYRIACERLAVQPGEALFIDDAHENVEAAIALGMRAVLFRDTEQAIDEVQRLLGIASGG